MIGMVGGHNARPARKAAREFDGALGGFGARVREINAVEMRWKECSDGLREIYLRALNKLTVDHRVQVPVGLRLDGFYDARMAVADVGYRNAADEVEILFPIDVAQGAALGVDDVEAERCGRRLGNVPLKNLTRVHR